MWWGQLMTSWYDNVQLEFFRTLIICGKYKKCGPLGSAGKCMCSSPNKNICTSLAHRLTTYYRSALHSLIIRVAPWLLGWSIKRPPWLRRANPLQQSLYFWSCIVGSPHHQWVGIWFDQLCHMMGYEFDLTNYVI